MRLLGINPKLLKLEKKDWSPQTLQSFALFAIQPVAHQRGIGKSYHQADRSFLGFANA
jgi:hypothetical protein